jgi:hypothetical protein
MVMVDSTIASCRNPAPRQRTYYVQQRQQIVCQLPVFPHSLSELAEMFHVPASKPPVRLNQPAKSDRFMDRPIQTCPGNISYSTKPSSHSYLAWYERQCLGRLPRAMCTRPLSANMSSTCFNYPCKPILFRRWVRKDQLQRRGREVARARLARNQNSTRTPHSDLGRCSACTVFYSTGFSRHDSQCANHRKPMILRHSPCRWHIAEHGHGRLLRAMASHLSSPCKLRSQTISASERSQCRVFQPPDRTGDILHQLTQPRPGRFIYPRSEYPFQTVNGALLVVPGHTLNYSESHLKLQPQTHRYLVRLKRQLIAASCTSPQIDSHGARYRPGGTWIYKPIGRARLKRLRLTRLLLSRLAMNLGQEPRTLFHITNPAILCIRSAEQKRIPQPIFQGDKNEEVGKRNRDPNVDRFPR